MQVLRADLIFSYWFLIWFVFYYFFNMKTYNPLFAFIVGFIVNVLFLFLFLANQEYYKTFLFLLCVLSIKVLPIYLLRDTKIKKKDIGFTFVLFFTYLLYITINGYSVEYIIKKFRYGTTPLENFFDQLINYFFHF